MARKPCLSIGQPRVRSASLVTVLQTVNTQADLIDVIVDLRGVRIKVPVGLAPLIPIDIKLAKGLKCTHTIRRFLPVAGIGCVEQSLSGWVRRNIQGSFIAGLKNSLYAHAVVQTFSHYQSDWKKSRMSQMLRAIILPYKS